MARALPGAFLMLHHDRRFGIRPTNSALELAQLLTEHVWTLCTGFELRGVLFLNDSFSVAGAQEYAVFRRGRQLASLTVSWLNQDELLQHVERLVAGASAADIDREVLPLLVDFAGHRCRRCA